MSTAAQAKSEIAGFADEPFAAVGRVGDHQPGELVAMAGTELDHHRFSKYLLVFAIAAQKATKLSPVPCACLPDPWPQRQKGLTLLDLLTFLDINLVTTPALGDSTSRTEPDGSRRPLTVTV